MSTPASNDNLAETFLPLLHTDPFAALEQLHHNAAPLDLAARYHSYLRHAYWKAHDLPAVIIIGRAGIQYCLAKSLEPATPTDLVEKLRSLAKSLAYDVGSFTWPGWEEPDITPTPTDLAFGRDCAQLNLRLALELKKPAEKISMAHWLIGAHALAAGNAAQAAEQFHLAQSVLPLTDPAASGMHPLNKGYAAIALLMQNPADPAAHEKFTAALAHFAARDNADAASSHAQLLAAHRLFVPPSTAR